MSDIYIESDRSVVQRPSRRLRILLVLSLSINLLIVGIVAGSIWAIRNGPLWNAPMIFERSQRFMSGLPEDSRGEVRSIFFQYKNVLRPYWFDLLKARYKINRLIEEENYSQKELNAALDEIFDKEIAVRQATKPMLMEMIAELRPEERVQFLRILLPYLDQVQTLAPADPATIEKK